MHNIDHVHLLNEHFGFFHFTLGSFTSYGGPVLIIWSVSGYSTGLVLMTVTLLSIELHVYIVMFLRASNQSKI